MYAFVVPFKGGTPAITDLMGGQVDFLAATYGTVANLDKEGRVRILALSDDKRFQRIPNVPTFAEFGVKDVDLPSYSAILAPPNMPPAVLSALYEGIAKTLRDPGLVAKLKANGWEPWTLPPEQFKTHLKGELLSLQRVLPPLGIQIDI